MTASIFSLIAIAICAVVITAVIVIALIRGLVAKLLYKIGFFKKEIRLDEHEKKIG